MFSKIFLKQVYRLDPILNFFYYILKRIYRIGRIKSNNLVILSFKFIGDTVFTIPTLQYIIERFPDYNIYILCYNESALLYKIKFDGLNIIEFDKKEIDFHKILPYFKIVKIIRRLNPDIFIDFNGSPQSAAYALLSRAGNIIGFNKKYVKSIYDIYSEQNNNSHLMNMYFRPFKEFYNHELSDRYKVFPVEINKQGDILIHPLAGWNAKEWGIRKFFDLFIKINEKYKCKFIFPKSSLSNDILIQFNIHKIDYTETDSFTHLIDEIKKCSLFIGCDSGPVNVASFLGKPTFTIYGPTNPLFHIPFVPEHQYIFRKMNCSPEIDNKYCLANGGKLCFHRDCMYLLEVDTVSKEILSFINQLDIETYR